MSLILYDQTEENYRKNWLLSTFAVFVLFPTLGILALVASIADKIPTYQQYGLEGCIILSSFMCVCSIPVLLLYWFAYKRHGNKLLMYLCVITTSKRVLFWIMGLFSHNSWIVIATLLDITVTVLWCILSFKMKKINNKIRSFKLPAKMSNG